MSKKKKTEALVLKSLLVLDEETKFLADGQTWAEPIYSANALFERISGGEPFESVIVLAELGWDGTQLENFYGFDLAVELRRKHKVTAPIIVISSLGETFFAGLANKQLKFKILFGRGTSFLRLRAFQEKLEETLSLLKKRPLESAVITDMNEMLFGQKGVVIDLLTHSLRDGMTSVELTKVFDEAEEYITAAQLTAINWTFFTQSLMANVSDKVSFEALREELLDKCESELFSEDKTEPREPIAEHKIVVLEDEPAFRAQIEKQLRVHFPGMVVTGNAEEVISEIDRDKQNQIKAVISDWRLYRDFDEKDYWQLQGYEVLAYVAKKHTAAMFALTSLSDYNVHNIRNELGFNLRLFKKQRFRNMPKNHWAIMADIIRQECDNVSHILSNGPTGAGWKLVREQYFEKRQIGWVAFEEEVAIKASHMYGYYIKAARIIGDDNREQGNFSSIDQENFTLKHVLKNVLIIRRVFLGLYFTMVKEPIYLQDLPTELCKENGNIDTELKQHALDCFSLLKQNWWHEWVANYPVYEIPERAASFDDRLGRLCYYLGIELTKLPSEGILPEEKLWFQDNKIDYKI